MEMGGGCSCFSYGESSSWAIRIRYGDPGPMREGVAGVWGRNQSDVGIKCAVLLLAAGVDVGGSQVGWRTVYVNSIKSWGICCGNGG